jgi:hypothetical protein
MSRYWNLIGAFATACNVAAAQQPNASPCNVKWPIVNAEAISRGLDFPTEAISGAGSCFTHKKSFVASASDSSNVTCKTVFFSGATIREGWSVVLIADAESPFAQTTTSAPGSLVVTMTASQGKSVVLVPRELQFQGPTECKKWLDALSIGSSS